MMKKLLSILALLPLVIGTIGYILSGEMFTDALYGAVTLYFTSPVSDAYNWAIEIARWTAPLVMATAILCVLQNIWEALKNRARLLGKKDSVSVYSDEDCRICFGKGVSVIYPGDKFKNYAHDHIIIFSTDEKNLQFYATYKKDLEGKNTYICVRNIESCFLNSLPGVTVFDMNGAISRLLWQEISLWNKGKTEFDIAIWGSNTLTENIICTGLQLNLFSLNQQIRYHIITDNDIFRIRHSELKLMNRDELVYLDSDDSNVFRAIENADIIIVSDVPDIKTMQTIVVKAGNSRIYYYSPNEGDVISYFSYGNIVPFGRNEMVLTDENIRRNGLLRKAIALNEHYANLYGTEKDWNALSGFLKGSNISASDFGEVLALLDEKVSEGEQQELEHIRWCRFMFLNYYTYGTPVNGKRRDDIDRMHSDLIGFDNLDFDAKAKDLETIRITKKLYV